MPRPVTTQMLDDWLASDDRVRQRLYAAWADCQKDTPDVRDLLELCNAAGEHLRHTRIAAAGIMEWAKARSAEIGNRQQTPLTTDDPKRNL